MKQLFLTLTFILFVIPFGISQDIILNGSVSVENNQIKNVGEPTENKDVTTKNYVDELIENLQQQIDNLNNNNSGNNTSGTVSDVDGNSYEYKTYGDQVWTVQNARMITYNDGTPIPQVTCNELRNQSTGAWCYYNDDSTKQRLYNWYAVVGVYNTESLSNTSIRKKFAPEGWHVPSNSEWNELEVYLISNGFNYDYTLTGDKIGKSIASTSEWEYVDGTGKVGNDQNTNNRSGFNVYPEGYIGGNGISQDEGMKALFWTSERSSPDYAYLRNLTYQSKDLPDGNNFIKLGMSVRFVKD
jgi:uncharacterized protein (TIGR02145 family)